MSYPSSIDTPRTVANVPGQTYDPTKTKRLYAEDINNANTSIVAIETELGTNPSASFTDVKDRLADMDTKIAAAGGGDLNVDMLQALGSSIKFLPPGNPYPIQGNSLVNQKAYFQSINVFKAATITGVMFYQAQQGNYTANNNCVIKLYSKSGGTLTEVATSGNIGILWKNGTDTWFKQAFTVPYSAAKGVYYIGILYCSSAQVTPPSIGNINGIIGTNTAQFDLTNSAAICMTINSQTNLTTPITLSSLAKNTLMWFLALY